MLYNYVGSTSSPSITLIFVSTGEAVPLTRLHPKWEDFHWMVVEDTLGDLDEVTALSMLSSGPTAEAGDWLTEITDRVRVTARGAYIDDTRVDEEIAKGLVSILGTDSEDSEHLLAIARFLEKADSNPKMENSKDLYKWLLEEGLTLAPDGDFIGYKSVYSVEPDNFDRVFGEVTLPNGDVVPASEVLPTDKKVYRASRAGGGITDGVEFHGHVPSYVGATVEMPRDEVDERGHVECSVGLHVGTYGYASIFGGDNLTLVKVNPRDVVSVPDYDFSKLRACRYSFVAEGVDNALDSKMYFPEQFEPVLEEVTAVTEPSKAEIVSHILDMIKQARA